MGQLIAKKLRQHPEYGLNLVGFVDDDPKERNGNLTDIALLGGLEQLPQMVQILDVERVIVAFSNDSHEEMLDLIRSLKDLDIQIDLVPRFFEVIGTNVGIHTAEGLPLIGLPALRLSRSSIHLKRMMDLVLSVTGLVLLSPLFLAVAVWIKLDSRGPVFFRQPGWARRQDVRDLQVPDDGPRRRRAQARVRGAEQAQRQRRRSADVQDPERPQGHAGVAAPLLVDELPQLLNVVKGEMSLVGPRPLILEEDQHVVDWRRQRLNLKPGVTGLWQVLGRDDIPFEEMVRLDYVYVTTWSMLNDLKLIIRTFPALIRSRAC